uniref:RNA-directed DNA polymerase n=1 Tax=Tanacetum cinerariifolium TaxID=118510 RepID=A0A699HY62_TANCI|nr:TPA: orf y [Tanacetum cinerariifolium]
MLVLPADPGLWLEVISGWESIIIYRLNNQAWSNNKAKLAFVENLLGESEKLTWQQWRTMYPEAYSTLEAIADEPKNITSQVRLLIPLKYPYRGSTDEQDRTYNLRKQENITRSTVYQELDLDDNWDIISADFDDSSAYSISKGEENDESDSDQEEKEEEDQFSQHAFMFHPESPTKIAEMVQTVRSWKPNKEFPSHSKECEHKWKENTVTNYTICYYCGILTTDMSRLNCPKCHLTTCSFCEKNYLVKIVNVKGKQPQKPEEEKDFSSNEVKLLKELLKEKTKQVKQMIKDQAKEYHENKFGVQKKEELWQSKESLLISDLTDALKLIEQLNTEQIRLEEQKDEETRDLNTTSLKVRKITNQLYNVKVEFDIPDCLTFGTTAIIDTGGSACSINKKVIPEEALEPLTQIVFFNGLNSRQHATHRIKQGSFLTEGNKFKIPLIYAFDMRDSNGIKMLIGANFLRSMKGGIRIEGDEITIYKKVTRIKTSNQTEVSEIVELEVSEEEFLEINESIYFNQEGSKAFLEQFKPVIDRLKHQGYIGEEPLKHSKKNGELCKLDIINLDITIEDRPLKHVTPAMEDSFRKHVDSFLKIGAIRLSKSRHRTMVMIINSGTTIDPITGREVKRKERMVLNYNSLNNNTYKDQYSLPGINTIIKRIGRARIFSKFDLKLGFHQVTMDEKSIPWTTFLVPGGLYEWLVMPFGLKITQQYSKERWINASKEQNHSSHGRFLESSHMRWNYKATTTYHKEDCELSEEELKTKKGLRSFLGILNYAQNHIPKLGILSRPLYEKTNAHGDKRLKPSDYEMHRRNEAISSNSSLLSGRSSTQKKQSKPCEAYKKSYNVRPKSALENLLKTTTGLTKEKTSEFKTKKPKESSWNWKPLHNDWAATTSKPNEVQDYKSKHNKCRFNRKGPLEDDNSSDDLIFIVYPG